MNGRLILILGYLNEVLKEQSMWFVQLNNSKKNKAEYAALLSYAKLQRAKGKDEKKNENLPPFVTVPTVVPILPSRRRRVVPPLPTTLGSFRCQPGGLRAYVSKRLVN